MIADAARLLQHVPEGRAFVDYLVETGFDPTLAGQLAAAQRSAPVTHVERLADLSALCDAFLLYDKLYVLRCETCPDAESLVLRTALADLGILEEIDATEYGMTLSDELVRFLQSVDADVAPALLAEVESMVQGALTIGDTPAEYDKTTTMIDAFRDGVEGTLVALSVRVPGPDPLTALARKVIDNVRYLGSGSLFGAVSDIRTFIYWRLATRLELPMYPSNRRLPSYQAINQHVDRSLREQAYGAVAEAFQTTVSEVYDADHQTSIYVPPGAALFLENMREHQSVPKSLIAMRKRFKPLRDAFRKLQEDTSTAGTIGELHQHKLRFSKVLEELRMPGVAGPARLETAIDLLPEITQMAANPLDLSAYSENLVRKPAVWIQNWWRKRPYRLVFQLRERLLGIGDYPNLLRDVTGVHISRQELRAYARRRDDDLFQAARRPGPITQADS